MIEKSIIIYSLVDDILKAIKHPEDCRRQMTDAEVITTALLAAIFFSGNLEKARVTLHQTNLIPGMLGKSRLCRRIHALADLIQTLFGHLGLIFKEMNLSGEYLLDSIPIPVCDNIRIKRCHLVQDEAYRGKCQSKRRYFYGVRLHILTTADGCPVEMVFFPGSTHDSQALSELPLDLPRGSELFTDSAYTHYEIEDALWEQDGIRLSPLRRKNAVRQDEYWVAVYKSLTRKKIESVFSVISQLFPKTIHAVTMKGFVLKICFFVFGYGLDHAFC